MPRTFSLGQLMLLVTLFCVIIGVTLRFTNLAIATVAAIGWVTPTLLVLVIVSRYSYPQRATVLVGLIGAVAAMCLVTPLLLQEPHRHPWPFWTLYAVNYFAIAIPPALGALLFSGLYPMARVKP